MMKEYDWHQTQRCHKTERRGVAVQWIGSGYSDRAEILGLSLISFVETIA